MSTLFIHIERNILLFQIIRSTVMYVIRWELFRFHKLIYNKPTQYIHTHTHDTHTWCVLFFCACDVIKCHYVIPLVLLVQRITPSVLPLKNKL